MFSHFFAADRLINAPKAEAQKAKGYVQRILEIWNRGDDVEWHIARHALKTKEEAQEVESSLIGTLGISKNGLPLNISRGRGNRLRGPRNAEQVKVMAAKPLKPTTPFDTVFVFQIYRGLKEGRTPYDATRMWWSIPIYLRERTVAGNAHIVGLVDGVSLGAYKIKRWEKEGTRWLSPGKADISAPLIYKDWGRIISDARGYVQHGGFLALEFDGRGKYRFIRGATDKNWRQF